MQEALRCKRVSLLADVNPFKWLRSGTKQRRLAKRIIELYLEPAPALTARLRTEGALWSTAPMTGATAALTAAITALRLLLRALQGRRGPLDLCRGPLASHITSKSDSPYRGL
jgi:hypothetical protein